jgi:hypothetical protein
MTHGMEEDIILPVTIIHGIIITGTVLGIIIMDRIIHITLQIQRVIEMLSMGNEQPGVVILNPELIRWIEQNNILRIIEPPKIIVVQE